MAEAAYYPDILITTTYLFITIVLADVLRHLAFLNLEHPNDSLLSKCVQEFIGTVELISVCYECSFVMEEYGPVVYSVYSFITGAWITLNWGGLVSANPFKEIINCFVGDEDPIDASLVLVTQALGCTLFYHVYLKHLWGLGFGAGHVHKYHSLMNGCSSEIKGTVMQATSMESFAVLVLFFIRRFIEHSDMTPISEAAVDSFVTVSLEMIAMNISGGFFNPLIATGFEIFCKINVWHHVIIFWIGPFVATVVAYIICQKVGQV